MDKSSCKVLVDFSNVQISAHADETPASSLVLGESSHRGLGFSEKLEETRNGVEASSEQMKETEDTCYRTLSSEKDTDQGIGYVDGDESAEDLLPVSSDENAGFLSFGGIRLYTRDISDEESEEDENGASLYEGNSDSSEMSDSYSEIDDEVAEDYLEGIGGGDNILGSKWLVEQQLDEYDSDTSSSSDFDETVEKLGGIALQEASREYGKRYSRSQNKNDATYARPLAIDDLILVKNPRIQSAKKIPDTIFPQSWPSKRSTYFRNIPGNGNDGCQASRQNAAPRCRLEANKFETRADCFEWGRYVLFSSYAFTGLFAGATVSGNLSTEEFLPRFWKKELIGAAMEDDEFSTRDKMRSMRVRKGSHLKAPESKQTIQRKLTKVSAKHGKSEAFEQRSSRKVDSFADKPVSFVSCGVMQSQTEITTIDSIGIGSQAEIITTKSADACSTSEGVVGSADFRSFEVHMKGFGSKMLAKMGYIEGGGLGKDGQGRAEPIKAVQLPKSLGLGVEFSNTIGVQAVNTPPKQLPTKNTPAKHKSLKCMPAKNNSVRNTHETESGIF